MATAGDIVTRALRLIGAYGGGQTPSAKDMAFSLETLNHMLFSWQNGSLAIDHATAAQTDTLNVPDSYLKAITYALATELMLPFERNIPAVVQIAMDETNKIRAVQRVSREVTTDIGVCSMSVQSRRGW